MFVLRILKFIIPWRFLSRNRFVMIHMIKQSASIRGDVQLPGDKSISHRYATLAAIAEGISDLNYFAASRDCHSTLDCLRLFGR